MSIRRLERKLKGKVSGITNFGVRSLILVRGGKRKLVWLHISEVSNGVCPKDIHDVLYVGE